MSKKPKLLNHTQAAKYVFDRFRIEPVAHSYFTDVQLDEFLQKTRNDEVERVTREDTPTDGPNTIHPAEEKTPDRPEVSGTKAQEMSDDRFEEYFDEELEKVRAEGRREAKLAELDDLI